jgi:DNA-binding PadR family transcriptional regulator
VSIRYGLLALLERRPMHGYQLRHEFETCTGATWPLNIGQVYSTLARLERDGLVTVTAEPDEAQRTYAITEAGQQELRAWFTTPVRQDAPPRDELAIKLALAVDTPGVDVLAVIQAQRTAAVRALQEYTRARESAADDLPWLLIADSLIFNAEAQIRWLDHTSARLRRLPPRQHSATTAPRQNAAARDKARR